LAAAVFWWCVERLVHQSNCAWLVHLVTIAVQQ
jgi:hypothetical protein